MSQLDLNILTLASGGHSGPDVGMCLLEWGSYVAGEAFSDHPECVCPVLGAFGRSLNDSLPDDKRQELKRFVPASAQAYADATPAERAGWILGTRDDGHAQTRAYMAVDWSVHTLLPAFLALSDRIDPSDLSRVNDLAPVTDAASAQAASTVVRKIREKAYDARRSAFAALRAKFPAAAAYAAYADAAAAAYAAAAYAAYADAAAAAAAADADVRAVVKKALAPTADRMQDSAIDLYTRMIRVGRAPAAD